MSINRPTDAEIMDMMKASLAAKIARQGRQERGETIAAHASCVSCRARRERSLRHCHLPSEPKLRHPSPPDTGAYVPEMAARVDEDRNLSDGARRCARRITEYVYRRDRKTREAEITVTYLAKALGRCRRTVQRYLRQLEREGYIEVRVVPSERTRMCFGLIVKVLAPLLPRHHNYSWPKKRGIPDATAESQNYRKERKERATPRKNWAALCCEGVWRAYMKTLPPPPKLFTTV